MDNRITEFTKYDELRAVLIDWGFVTLATAMWFSYMLFGISMTLIPNLDYNMPGIVSIVCAFLYTNAIFLTLLVVPLFDVGQVTRTTVAIVMGFGTGSVASLITIIIWFKTSLSTLSLMQWMTNFVLCTIGFAICVVAIRYFIKFIIPKR